MTAVLTVLHVLACVFLVAVVLLQRGKGAEIGAVFGSGASSTVFGSRGAGNFLTKLTTGSAVVFMLTSLTLSYMGTTAQEDRLFQDSIDGEAAAEDTLFEEVGTVPAATEDADASAFEEVGTVPAAEPDAQAAEPATAPDSPASP